MKIEDFPDSSFFDRFPKGCCGDTSILLNKYLMEHNIRAEYVSGIDKNRQSHAWLEYEGWILDITADQFKDVSDKVLISKDRTWHSQFKGQHKGINDFEKFNIYNKNRLSVIYSNIKETILNESKK